MLLDHREFPGHRRKHPSPFRLAFKDNQGLRFLSASILSHVQIGWCVSNAPHITHWAQVSSLIWIFSAILDQRNHALISPSICSLPKA